MWQTLLVLVLACGLFLLDARNPRLHHDEAYTILAARSWLADGTFRIWQGEYVRVKGYTVLVAWSLAAFGDTLLAARLPSVIAAALLVAFAFYWTRRQVSAAAAWTVATLLCFSSFVIGISHYARFYALHGLLFWIAAVSLYAVFPDMRRASAKLALLAVAGAALLGARYLQPVTLLGVVGLAAWAVLDGTFRKGVLQALWRREWRAVTAAAALIAAATLSPHIKLAVKPS